MFLSDFLKSIVLTRLLETQPALTTVKIGAISAAATTTIGAPATATPTGAKARTTTATTTGAKTTVDRAHTEATPTHPTIVSP
jgi:hypothetical protein